MQVTRRTVLAGAGASTALAGKAQAQASTDPLYEAAKQEGQLSWYAGTFTQPVCEQVVRAFSHKYPGIAVSAIRTPSQVAFQRLMEELRGG